MRSPVYKRGWSWGYWLGLGDARTQVMFLKHGMQGRWVDGEKRSEADRPGRSGPQNRRKPWVSGGLWQEVRGEEGLTGQWSSEVRTEN